MSRAHDWQRRHRMMRCGLYDHGRQCSSQRLVQPVQQPGARLDRGEVHLLVMGMCTLAVDAEAVEGCGQWRGEIAVRAAAGADIDEIEADFGVDRFGVL